MHKTVLVTGIGGVVGQGVLRNIIHCGYEVGLIGTNTVAVSGGNHLCDAVYTVPFGDEPTYIPAMKRICTREKVDFIIPTTDAESYYLALTHHELPPLSTSSVDVAWTFFNKLKTWESFQRAGIPFAETVLPSAYNNNFLEYIVKPITGRGSRNIFISPEHPDRFSDDYIIQKLYKGKEITTAFYVTKKKQLFGFITFERLLQHGFTYQCEVTTQYEKQMEKMIYSIMSNFDIRGSCNIQCIVEQSSGRIIPFEVNGRISGTNSIRAQFGFEDVRYTLDEYLYGKMPSVPRIRKGAAVRVLLDVIYPDKKLSGIQNKYDAHYIF